MKARKEKNAGLTNTVSSYSLVRSAMQTRNSGELVTVSDVLDDTEGLAAMDTLPLKKGSRNLDLGGGHFDGPSKHIWKSYRVTNLVYDPYNRSKNHNSNIRAKVRKHPVDSVTSCSVLNVILDKTKRKAHIQFAYKSLKSEGIAFFKIWRGNNSRIPNTETFQSNKEAKYYLKEIQKVFGRANTELIKDDIGNTIFAYKL
jgi:hypothetical protein